MPKNASVQEIQSFYDEEASRYYSTRYIGDSADSVVWRSRADVVLELTGDVGGVVVDLGCGPGVLAPRLVRQAGRLISADLSWEMLRVGRDNLGPGQDAHWINCDLSHLPFATGSVEALLVIGVYGLVEDRAGVLHEFARVVQPGGRLIIQTPNAWSPRKLVEKGTRRLRLSRREAYENRLATHGIDPRPLRTAEFAQMLRTAGFVPRRRRYYDFRLPFLSRLGARTDARTAAVLHRLLHRRPVLGQLGEGLVLEAERR
ncbi:MAG: methyltransferase domain-containing protein [Hamadaea sp.]|nr:methyltransferase domain-containing protein [Hamadaea sp.]